MLTANAISLFYPLFQVGSAARFSSQMVPAEGFRAVTSTCPIVKLLIAITNITNAKAIIILVCKLHQCEFLR